MDNSNNVFSENLVPLFKEGLFSSVFPNKIPIKIAIKADPSVGRKAAQY